MKLSRANFANFMPNKAPGLDIMQVLNLEIANHPVSSSNPPACLVNKHTAAPGNGVNICMSCKTGARAGEDAKSRRTGGSPAAGQKAHPMGAGAPES